MGKTSKEIASELSLLAIFLRIASGEQRAVKGSPNRHCKPAEKRRGNLFFDERATSMESGLNVPDLKICAKTYLCHKRIWDSVCMGTIYPTCTTGEGKGFEISSHHLTESKLGSPWIYRTKKSSR